LLPWLALPLPLNRDQQLVSFLQRLSSRLSSFMLDWVGVIHLMDGNTLLLGEKQFFVDEACSGIISVMSIIACAVIYGVWRNRPPLHLVVLAAAGVGWATLMNVARISVIALVYQWYGVDWSKGTPHEILGLVIFLLTFLALVSTDYVLLVLLTPIGVDYVKQYGQRIRHGAWLVAAWDWLLSRGRPALAAWPSGAWPPEEYPAGGGANPASSVERRERQESGEEPPRGYLAKGEGNSRALAARFVLGVVPLAAFGALAAAQLAIPHAQRDPSRMPHNLERALALVATSLPTELSSAKQTKFTAEERARDDVFGNFSRIYQYQDRYGNIYLVSCDFPLEAGGHELTVCYEGIGWQMVRREVRPDPEKSQNPLTTWGYAEADFTMPDGSAAALAFCSFDEYGTRVTPPSYSLWDDFWRSLQRQSWANRSERTFQVQVWTTAAGTVHEEQKQLARDLLLGVRNRFRELVTGEVDRGEN
jgi:exosortase/archaeosortase family protein